MRHYIHCNELAYFFSFAPHFKLLCRVWVNQSLSLRRPYCGRFSDQIKLVSSSYQLASYDTSCCTLIQFPAVAKELITLVLGSKFTHYQPSTVPRLIPLTLPCQPSFCLLPPLHSFKAEGLRAMSHTVTVSASEPTDDQSPLDMLISAARECAVTVQVRSMSDEEDWENLYTWLVRAAVSPCWVVLQHCHLCQGFPDWFKKVAQVNYAQCVLQCK